MAFTLADSFASLESQTAGWDEADAPGTITISGTSYDCAALINRIEPTPTEKGYEEVQTARVDLRKALCSTCPTRADSFTLGGYNNWKLIATGGQNATDLAWVLTLHRRVKP